MSNRGDEEVNLSSFSLGEVDPESGEVAGGGEVLRIDAGVSVPSGRTVSVGREPRVVDADGREVAGTFSGGSTMIEQGDLVALLDGSGAVVDTVSV